MTKRRVVVTGLGAVTPLGLDVNSTWASLMACQSGVAPITDFDTSDLKTTIMAAVKDFDPLVALTPKEVKRYDRFVHLGVVASKEAYTDAGLTDTNVDPERLGVAVGSGIGGLPWIVKNALALEKGGARKVSPFFIPGGIINMLTGLIAIKLNCKGPNVAIVTACTTGTHNIGHAARMIAYGDADVMLAGGSEDSLSKLSVAGFSATRALSIRNDDPTTASRPFERDRDGFVIGEGAGVMVLESYEHAKARGAKIYAELAGFGMSDDASHITMPDENASGAIRSMQHALRDADLSPADIDYVNAHGTSTRANDSTEAKAFRAVFDNDANRPLVSSTKSMTGHLLGAAGAVEAVFSVLAMKENKVPPTINLDHVDPACEGFDYVPHTVREHTVNCVLSNSFGFGGTNGTLVFKRS